MINSQTNKLPFILIIDDELMNIKMLESFLRKEGYQTLSAISGPEGRELAIKNLPDLILLDIMMKNEDGFETCIKLKEDIRTSDIPVIFISAMQDTASKIRGLNIGAVDYITKPFEREEVLARTRIHLKLSFVYRTLIEEQTKKLKQVKDAQQAILVQPEDFQEANFAVAYSPIHEAGGDFYDVFSIGKDIFGYFIADISGHDIGTSFATAALKALLKQNSQPIYTPIETLKIMNSVLGGLINNGSHITACYAHLNRYNNRLTILSAGHPPLIFIADGQVTKIEAEGDILGVFTSVFFNPIQKKVKKGDRFFLYTDGLLERFGEQKKGLRQGLDALMKCCYETRGIPLKEAVDEIIKRLMPGIGVQEDDLMLMGVEI